MSLLTSAADLAIGNPIPMLLGGFKRLAGLLGAIAAKINAQGWLGLAASLLLFVHFGGDARHWHKVATRQTTLLTVANRSVYNLRMASFDAADRNRATVDRDEAQRAQVTKDTHDAYQVQLARLRADFSSRVRAQSGAGQSHAGDGGLSPLSASAGRIDGQVMPGAAPDILYTAELELRCNALIDWTRKQSSIDPNAP